MNSLEAKDPLFSILEIGVRIHRLNKELEKKIGLTLVQWGVLKKLLNRPSISANALAMAVGVSPSAFTQTLSRLERKGFVMVLEDPKDSRKKLISITRLGHVALEHSTEVIHPLSASFKKYLPEILRIHEVLLTLT